MNIDTSRSLAQATALVPALALVQVLAFAGCGGSSTMEGKDAGLGPDDVSSDGGVSAPNDGGESAPCPQGSFDHDSNSETECVAWSTCGAGEHVAEAGSDLADRVCAGCGSGTFSEGPNAEACATWTACAAGSYVAREGDSTRDRECASCPEETFTSGPNQSVCVPLEGCAPGTVQTAPATSTSPATCAPCEAGQYCPGGELPAVGCGEDDTWDHDADPATACAPRTVCTAGHYATTQGSALTDRSCAACATGSYSADVNAAACIPWADCEPGEHVVAAGTRTRDRSCAACPPASFSTTVNASACTPWTSCVPGQHVREAGTSTSDRVCAACSTGTFSTANDQLRCAPWSACPTGFEEDAPGTSTTDRTCVPAWTRQFGSSAPDRAFALAIDAEGAVLVAGQVRGTLPGQTSSGNDDAFVRKYDNDGTVVWTRQFGLGPNGNEVAMSVSVDAGGNVLVVGEAISQFAPIQAFVRKYDGAGMLLWSQGFGTDEWDAATSVRVGPDGGVLVAGFTGGTFDGQASAGRNDAFVRKLDGDGNVLWTHQFGSEWADGARSVSVAGDNTVIVSGYTGGTLPGQTTAGGTDAFVRKLSADGNVLWTHQFGTSATDDANAVSVDASGDVLVVGHTYGELPGQTSAGLSDVFVRKLSADGVVLWSRQIGTSLNESANAIAVGSDGTVYVTGTTGGTLPGQANAGSTDVFVLALDPSGALERTRQLGTTAADRALGVGVDARGSVIVAGGTEGAFPGQSSVGREDAFVMKLWP